MNSEIVVLQGKTFITDLQSNLGSTNYGWCVASLPPGIILMRTDNLPPIPPSSVVIQRFYFGVVSAEQINVTIDFALTCWSNLTEVSQRFQAKVRIVPSDSREFVAYSENNNPVVPYGFAYTDNGPASPAVPYGFAYTDNSPASPVVPYGFAYTDNGPASPVMPYGFVYTHDSMQNAQSAKVHPTPVKYGYPCGVQDAGLKYGYPCGVQDAGLKYGYPCGVQDAGLKYGYPCMSTNRDLK